MNRISTDTAFRMLAVCLASTLLVGLGIGVARADSSLEERVRQLEELVRQQGALLEKQQQHIDAQNRRMERQQERLKTEAEAAHAKGAPIAAAVPVGDPTATAASTGLVEDDADQRVEVSTGYGGIDIKSADGKFKFRLGGRAQFDWAAYDSDVTPFGSGAEVRRARFVGQGTLWSVWKYKLELNFSTDNEAEVTDAWFSYNGFKPVSVKVGHQKVPFGQQTATSSNWQVFQERALTDAFIDTGETGRRRLGVAAEANGDLWMAHVGAFGEGIDDDGGSDQDWGAAGRFLLQPIAKKDKVAAVGGSVYYRDFNGDNDLRFRSRPESHVGNTRLIDTGDLVGEDDLLMYNAEATGVLGPAHAQFEYAAANVGRGGFSNPTFEGYYVQAGYFLTGESRNYDKKVGKYKRVMPNGIVGDGGLGAWEVAARYSNLDLQDGGVDGGKQWDVTLALNWWATPSILLRLNYVHAEADPNSAETLLGIDESVDVFQGRAQVVF